MKSTKNTIRIIGGEHRRQLIPVLQHEGLRPSSDRVRETVFNWMTHQWGGEFGDKKVLDAFAGSGAFGLECISRGASDVLMLDTYAPAIAQIQKALDKWQVGADARAKQQSFLDFARQTTQKFDWIILDPPFGHNWSAQIAPELHELTHADTWLYVETEKTADVSCLHEQGWMAVRTGQTQQATYGLWQRRI